MTKSELESKMDELQVKEAEAYNLKLKCENDITGYKRAWYEIYQEYELCKKELKK